MKFIGLQPCKPQRTSDPALSCFFCVPASGFGGQMAAPVLRQISWSQFLLFELEGVCHGLKTHRGKGRVNDLIFFFFPGQDVKTGVVWLWSHGSKVPIYTSQILISFRNFLFFPLLHKMWLITHTVLYMASFFHTFARKGCRPPELPHHHRNHSVDNC